MNNLRLNIKITGCPNKCFYCHSLGGGRNRVYMDIDTIIRTASFFREKLQIDVSVLLMEEQTYYPDFFDLIAKLENEGFMRKESNKWLITNCFGLCHVQGFIDRMKNHFNLIQPTLFGQAEIHDKLSGRKGSYDDIITASKVCLEKDIKVIWNLKWSSLNTEDMNSLSELAESLGINSFINCEYYFYGYFHPNNADKYLPVVDDLAKLRYEVAEFQQGTLKTAKQFYDDIKNGITYEIKTVSFDDLYVTEDFNVYPLGHISNEYCLGNIKDTPDHLIDNILYGINLPETISHKRKQDFSEMVLKYADVTSNILHTPQSLFDMLYVQNN